MGKIEQVCHHFVCTKKNFILYESQFRIDPSPNSRILIKITEMFEVSPAGLSNFYKIFLSLKNGATGQSLKYGPSYQKLLTIRNLSWSQGKLYFHYVLAYGSTVVAALDL